MPSKTFQSLVPPKLKELTEPTPLKGSQIERVIKHNDLHLTEVGMALGINTAALYSKKALTKDLQSSVSILLRLYAAFPEMLPKIDVPSIEELGSLIESIDPAFVTSYSIGPLLGLETNSSYRFSKAGFGKSAQTTRVLAWLIYELLKQDPQNWWVIKEAVEVEASARQIFPAENVWKYGGWKRYATQDTSQQPENRNPEQAGETTASARPENAARPLRRRTKA